jgi:hypothetical protein
MASVRRDDVLGICARMPGSVEDYPFGDGVAVFKVSGRMFALVPLEGDPGRTKGTLLTPSTGSGTGSMTMLGHASGKSVPATKTPPSTERSHHAMVGN